MKRLTSLSLAVVLSGSLLAGCAGGSDPKNEGGQASPQSSGEVYENGLPKNEKVTLKVGFFMGGYGREWFDYAVKSFKEKYPNVSFDVTASADMKNMIQTKVSANNDADMFDIFNTTPPAGAQGIVSLAEAGKLEPWDELFDKKLPDAPDKTVKELILPGMYESFTRVNGKVYEFASSSSFGGLFYNKTLFEKTAGTRIRKHGRSLPSFWPTSRRRESPRLRSRAFTRTITTGPSDRRKCLNWPI